MPFDLTTAAAVVAAVALVLLPGAAVLDLLGVRLRDHVAQLGLAIGLGCALSPLAWLWLDLLRIPINRPVVAALTGLAALALAVSVARRRRVRQLPDGGSGDRLASATVAVLALAALAARWWSARDLDLPRWGDSVHHTIIVDLMTQAAALPADWRPYAELGSFSYHFGFHSLAAGIVHMSGLAPHQAVIVAGQVLMVGGIATAYALGATLSGRPWVGAGAALAAAGLSTMPAYYLNWGRYTQLAGQVILPAAAAALVLAARSWARSGGNGQPLRQGLWSPNLVAAAILAAGLALTHYIVVLFLLLFVVAWLVVGDPQTPAGEGGPALLGAVTRADRRQVIISAAVAAAAGAMIALPWVPHFLAGPIGGYALSLSTARPPDPAVFGVNPAREIWLQADSLIGGPLLAALALGAILTLRTRDRAGGVSLVWVLALVIATHPALLGLPVSGVLKSFTVAIGLYVAAGPTVGVLTAATAARGRKATAATLCGIAVAAAWLSRAVLVPETRLVGDSDPAALAWVREHTPPDATFLVSAFPAFGETAVAGDDAGWWLPYVSGRASTLPPITYVLERPFDEEYPERVNELVRLWHHDLDGDAARSALDEAGVTHAFVGEVARANDAEDRGQGLALQLSVSPYWALIHQEGASQVWERVRIEGGP